jgi:hypothetical protein
MGKLTDYAKNKMLNELTGRTNTLDFGSIYLALFLESSTIIDVPNGSITGGVEPSSANGYARALVGNYAQTATILFGAANGGSIENDKEINFPSVQNASWGEVGYWALYDSTTGGNCLAYGHLLNAAKTQETTVTPQVGEKVYFAVGAIDIEFV